MKIRFDGVYQSDPVHSPHGNYWDYLRFYQDGEVLSASSTGTPADLADWFVRENKKMSIGRCSIDGDNLSFETETPGDRIRLGIPSAAVAYTGRVQGDVLVLDSVSHVNGYRTKGRRYSFHEAGGCT